MSGTMFPHVVTVYNTDQHPVTFEPMSGITILNGVLFDASKAANVSKSGLQNADSVNLYIPFDVEAIDGVSLFPKTYLTPKEYRKADDKSQFWTLDTKNCFFAKGSVVEPERDFMYINANYDDVHEVTSVDTKDFGNLKHWQVGGK